VTERLDDELGFEVVVVVDFFSVVVVVDDVESLPDFFLVSGTLTVVVVEGGGGGGSVVTVTVLVVEGTAAADTPIEDPAVVPGRGSVLAGDSAGFDAAPAEGLAEATSVGGDVGGAVVWGAATGGRATWVSPGVGTDRAACSALRTSGWDNGDTRLVEKRDETSCTPKSPRSTPLAVPRAHVTTRTRRITLYVRRRNHMNTRRRC